MLQIFRLSWRSLCRLIHILNSYFSDDLRAMLLRLSQLNCVGIYRQVSTQ